MRVFWIVLDSAGIGYEPDAELFGDVGADTFGSCIRYAKEKGLDMPNLRRMGLFNIEGTSFRDPAEHTIGAYGRLRERSMGKDTTVGHWEMAGMVSPRPLPVYPEGFPEEIRAELTELTGKEYICNLPYSGTKVLEDYGREHVESGKLILYTSADSVMQIAAHEDLVPVEELYDICRKARELMQGPHGVGRIIARPFTGEYPNYQRTVRRHDFSLCPPEETVLDGLTKAGIPVIGVGKIYDIFAGKGVGETYANEGNCKNMIRTMEIARREQTGLCYVNLVDFDMIYGHRRDIPGYTEALVQVDGQLGELMELMGPEDVLMVTADHGCDPGFTGTDHTREYVPCLIYGQKIREDLDLKTRSTYADMGATVAELLGIDYRGDGESFAREILKQ